MRRTDLQRLGFRFLLIGIIVGLIIEVIFKKKEANFKTIRGYILKLIFTIVVPLVFISITSSVESMVNIKRLGKILDLAVMVFLITRLFASAVVLLGDPG